MEVQNHVFSELFIDILNIIVQYTKKQFIVHVVYATVPLIL